MKMHQFIYGTEKFSFYFTFDFGRPLNNYDCS